MLRLVGIKIQVIYHYPILDNCHMLLLIEYSVLGRKPALHNSLQPSLTGPLCDCKRDVILISLTHIRQKN